MRQGNGGRECKKLPESAGLDVNPLVPQSNGRVPGTV